MASDTATLYCPNCQAPNPESHNFCDQCRTALPKRYLWAVGQGAQALNVGELLAGRYWVKQPQILLDTQPGLTVDVPDGISAAIAPYLKLVTECWRVPQVYGSVRSPHHPNASIFLLEHAPIDQDESADRLMPALASVWKQSTALRQLHWLWQIAMLWQPLSSLEVGATLLDPSLLRVEGSLLRLLELRADGKRLSTLKDLAQQWQLLQAIAQPEIADFLASLCEQMQQEQIRHPEQLVRVLDQALAICGQTQTRRLDVATLSDRGPSRARNEDACYPLSGMTLTLINPGGTIDTSAADCDQPIPMVVVCDGIGGHEGGNVASNLAIAVVEQQLQSVWQTNAWEPERLVSQLEQAALVANDVIAQRNDTERRQERQRMGTTLVMAVAHTHHLYLAHVGDSRAYRITRTGCHQVTLDDDLAAREVRLGYAIYRDALEQPGAGSLVQALGMNASSMLHPTVQRFVLDEDCLFLLCSDGLSDRDRIEEYWQTELLPVLQGKVDVATASQRLVALANQLNGHDNVTVGLIHCQISPSDRPSVPVPASLVDTSLTDLPDITQPSTPLSNQKTQILSQRSPVKPMGKWLGLVGLVTIPILAAFLAYQFIPATRTWVDSLPGEAPSPLPEAVTTPLEPSLPPPPPPSPVPLVVGSLIQVIPSTIGGIEPEITLLAQPQRTAAPATPVKVPPGSILQVDRRQVIADQGIWLRLKVCSIPATGTVSAAKPGIVGWVEETAIAPLVTQPLEPSTVPLGQCATPSTSTASPKP